MIEAELKARVPDPPAVRAQLAARATEERAVYYDTYYDWPDRRLTTAGCELRRRVLEDVTSGRRTQFLTFKAAAVDAESDSKPEHEATLGPGGQITAILGGLGLVERVRYTKHCLNYRFTADGRFLLATLATVPELEGTYLEVESIVEPHQVEGALTVIRGVLAELGLLDHLDTSKYTEAVLQAREGG
ncbi:class IV adenylate cyclase [Flindersiella endophytica]